MKRYEVECGYVEEDESGPFVLFQDYWKELAAKDLEIAELRKDAERYRWIREFAANSDYIEFSFCDGVRRHMLSMKYADIAIDAAIEAEEQAK